MLIYKQGFLFCYKCFYVDDSYKHIGHSRTPNPYEKCHRWSSVLINMDYTAVARLL